MSSRSTSPDPILEPSPAPVGHQARQESAKPPASPPKRLSRSPTKSFIMKTGKPGDVSPMRIRVTLSAQPMEGGSPSPKRSRTTKVPLKGLSSSPNGRGSPKKRLAEGEAEDGARIHRRPQRKRKGTPMARETKSQRERFDEEDESPSQVTSVLSSPAKRALSARTTQRLPRVPTERTQRLLHARRERDHVIEHAVLSSDRGQTDEIDVEAGEMTVANEDFTMVSVETLETMKNNTSLLNASKTEHAEKSEIGASYFPSSPPQPQQSGQENSAQIQYPDLSKQIQNGSSSPSNEAGHDAMSWNPTGLAKAVPYSATTSRTRQYEEPSELQQEREIVSKQIDNASASQVIIINDETELLSHDATDGDIWAEEASREEESLTAPQIAASRIVRRTAAVVTTAEPKSTAEQLNDLFSALPAKPPRSKIPRTWRRTSGVEFSYVDSPAPGSFTEKKSPQASKHEERDGSESRRGGVLTPPGTDDEVAIGIQQNEEVDSSLTAAEEAQKKRMDAIMADKESEESDEEASADDDGAESSSSGSPCSMDRDDTGLFFQSNLPNVYRRQRAQPERQNAMDLSDLFAAGNSSSPAKPRGPEGVSSSSSVVPRPASRTGNFRRPALEPRDANESIGAAGRGQGGEASKQKVVYSPLRKSLLKSSKIGGGLVTSTPMQLHAAYPGRYNKKAQVDFSTVIEQSDTDAVENLGNERLAQSDTNNLQLVAEGDNGEGAEHDVLPPPPGDKMKDEVIAQEQTLARNISANDGADKTLLSYEEHLNIDSPQKVKVNFRDTPVDFAVLAPKRLYPPLFWNDSNEKVAELSKTARTAPEEAASESVTPDTTQQTGIISRLASGLWNAVIRPSGPNYIMPEPTPSDVEIAMVNFPDRLRARVRSRYGILSSTHPWTFAHMWTIHRMRNSQLNNQIDSLIPKSGTLPSCLEEMVGKHLLRLHTYTEQFCFTREHAHVVHTLMQTLVPQSIVTAMEKGEIGFLGDEESRISRGQYADRHGKGVAFTPRPDYYVEPDEGSEITMEFVARTVGNVLIANRRNEEFAAKLEQLEQFARRQRRHEVRVRQLEESRLREEVGNAAFGHYDHEDDDGGNDDENGGQR